MWYLTPWAHIQPQYRPFFGLIETLGSNHDPASWPAWAMDNGRFSAGGVNPRWTEDAWLAQLDYYAPEQRARCLFSVVPDAPYDASATLALFARYRRAVVSRGYTPALATQDGMVPDDIPWDDVGAVFLGGTDDHKLGAEGLAIAQEARRRGVWLHIGRVNSQLRMRRYWYADSVDGTYLAISGKIVDQRRLVRGLSYCRALKRQEMLPCMS